MNSSYPGARVIQAHRDATNVWVHLNVVYATRDQMPLRLQIIQPSLDGALLTEEAAFAGRYPLLIFVQGSGWQQQELGLTLSYLCRFAELGYVIAVVEYRPAPEASMPAQVLDTKAATRFLLDHADEYSINPSQVVITGDSSGGHTALMVHLSEAAGTLVDPDQGGPLPIKAAIAIYPPTDLPAMLPDDFLTWLFGIPDGPERRELARSMSPINLVDSSLRLSPLLLIHGDADDLVPIDQSVRYFQTLKQQGQPVELVVVTDAKHGSWPSLFSPEVGQIAHQFLKRALGR